MSRSGRVGRNEPCPCGSGKKHKHCCWDAERDPAANEAGSARLGWLALLALVVAAFGVYVYGAVDREPEEQRTMAYPVAAPTPMPWHFDVANNRHWDPTEGHKHWHAGPPPAPENRPAQ